jgi:hypothetical protein
MKTLEFYGSYKEDITQLSDKIDVITGVLDMHAAQIARNTADIKKMKTA